MAGIGFALRRLSNRDDLYGTAQAMLHSSLASAGPWLMTILTLGGLSVAVGPFVHHMDVSAFRLVLIYNFASSLIFSGPVVVFITRCLADQIYAKDVRAAPAMLLGAMLIVFATQMPLAVFFYFSHVVLAPEARIAAFVNLFLINAIWVASVFLTALKDYRSVSASFAIGMLVAAIAGVQLGRALGMTGLLVGFDLGLAFVTFGLVSRVFAEYPYPVRKPFGFLQRMGVHWQLVLSGFFYNAAIWVDKIIMAFCDEAEVFPSRMISYPDYNAAMFAAYLSIVPSLAIFVLRIETSFFEKYLKFYRDIQEHCTYADLQRSHRALIADLIAGLRTFLVPQLAISAVVILLAPKILGLMSFGFSQLGIFRLGVLGALFHALFLFLSIILSYFDLARVNLMLQIVFFGSNLVFTIVSLHLGFAFYGYGYFASCLVTFSAAFLVAAYYIRDLPFQTFIRGNPLAR